MSSFFKNFAAFANAVSTATFTTGISAATRQANSAFKDYLEQSKQDDFRTCGEIDELINLPVAQLHEKMGYSKSAEKPAEAKPAAKKPAPKAPESK